MPFRAARCSRCYLCEGEQVRVFMVHSDMREEKQLCILPTESELEMMEKRIFKSDAFEAIHSSAHLAPEHNQATIEKLDGKRMASAS